MSAYWNLASQQLFGPLFRHHPKTAGPVALLQVIKRCVGKRKLSAGPKDFAIHILQFKNRFDNLLAIWLSRIEPPVGDDF